ncbi:MAG: hypothetical protein CVU22_20890 [Betaproteobacteria bacterium HGW-Betaproteobacteria-16]|nr:MAG: hypothetical protein CVU22_20890 [Betaproteobacteria bacterium HGW-Betaproteobacteria-16]
MPIKEQCRNGGFRDATFFRWRARFGGMHVSEAQRLRELESEKAKLKRLLAKAHPEMYSLKGCGGKRSLHRPDANAKQVCCSSDSIRRCIDSAPGPR